MYDLKKYCICKHCNHKISPPEAIGNHLEVCFRVLARDKMSYGEMKIAVEDLKAECDELIESNKKLEKGVKARFVKMAELKKERDELKARVDELEKERESSMMLSSDQLGPKIEESYKGLAESYSKFARICVDILNAHKIGDSKYVCTTEMYPFMKRIDVALGLRREGE